MVLFKYREKAAYVIRQKSPLLDSSKDSTGAGGHFFLPVFIFVGIGVFIILLAVARTFDW